MMLSFLLIACSQSDPAAPPSEVTAESKPNTEVHRSQVPATAFPTKKIIHGMLPVPAGLVKLGPRQVKAVQGWQSKDMLAGVTPNQGQRGAQRDAGGPPIPGQFQPQGQPHSGHSPGDPQHKAGVGHIRPGSGVPSAPPNMPGAQVKSVGSEEKWTANPGLHLRSKMVSVGTFWIDQTEVTRGQYYIFLQETGYRPPFVSEEWAMDEWNWLNGNFPPGTREHPVVMVSWFDASAYCEWADKRLPTEAEWQLAALGDARQKQDYPWGKSYSHNIHNHGQMAAPNFDSSDGYLTTSPVGSYPEGASPVGALDMFGNAWEFTADFRRASWTYYTGISQQQNDRSGLSGQNPSAPGPGLYVAVRGGSYFFDLRPNPGGERNEFLTEVRRKTSGFRCASSKEPTK